MEGASKVAITKTAEKLKKSIGLVDAIFIVVGMVIGSGIFLRHRLFCKMQGTPLWESWHGLQVGLWLWLRR